MIFLICLLIVFILVIFVLDMLFIKHIVKWSDKYLGKYKKCKYNYDVLNQWFKLKQININTINEQIQKNAQNYPTKANTFSNGT